jgi:hypothetical protein
VPVCFESSAAIDRIRRKNEFRTSDNKRDRVGGPSVNAPSSSSGHSIATRAKFSITTQSPRRATATSRLQPADDHVAEALIFRGQDELTKIPRQAPSPILSIEPRPPKILKIVRTMMCRRETMTDWQRVTGRARNDVRGAPCRSRAAFVARAPQFDGADIQVSTRGFAERLGCERFGH